MQQITRREFTAQALAGLGTTMLAAGAAGQTQPQAKLPTVRWGGHEISRLLVGHNPVKGMSHFSRFEEEARQSMAKTLGQVSKPCIAFKVLGANRHCKTAADVEAALRFALAHLKPTDVVLLGMWQKHKDQVGENAATARRILGAV